MKCFDANDGTFVTLSVHTTETGQIELVRKSANGVAVYYDSPEDALRRWNVWTSAAVLQCGDKHGGADIVGTGTTKL